jgi:hypothetical protein
MSMFRRGNTGKKSRAKLGGKDEPPSESGREVPEATGDDDFRASQPQGDAGEPVGGGPARASGPWDISEVTDPAADGRVDLGGLWLPAFEGLEIRVEADPETGSIVSVTLVLDDSALQVQPFAAPRTEGIWAEVRTEIAAGLTQQGGTADMVEGPFGTELRARMPVTRSGGASGVEAARFIGVDGPRWFLRGAFTGRAAAQPAEDEPLLDVFREIVVVRGPTPMAPREPIPLTLPQAVQEAGPEAKEALEPFQRGPEITEIR